MSLKPKEVRVPCSDELLKAIEQMARAQGLTMGEWCRRVVVDHLARATHEASVVLAATAHLGELRKDSDCLGGRR